MKSIDDAKKYEAKQFGLKLDKITQAQNRKLARELEDLAARNWRSGQDWMPAASLVAQNLAKLIKLRVHLRRLTSEQFPALAAAGEIAEVRTALSELINQWEDDFEAMCQSNARYTLPEAAQGAEGFLRKRAEQTRSRAWQELDALVLQYAPKQTAAARVEGRRTAGQRGRPRLPEKNKREAATARAEGKSWSQVAKVLYDVKTADKNQKDSARKVVQNYLKSNPEFLAELRARFPNCPPGI